MIPLFAITYPVIESKLGNPAFMTDEASVLRLFVSNFIKIGYVIGAITCFFMLIWGSVEYITAGGDKERVGSASKRMVNALTGLGILLSLFVILRLVRIIFGINILSLDIPFIL